MGKTRIKIDCIYLEVWLNTLGDNRNESKISVQKYFKCLKTVIHFIHKNTRQNYCKPIDLTDNKVIRDAIHFICLDCIHIAGIAIQYYGITGQRMSSNLNLNIQILGESFLITAGTLTQYFQM